MNYLSGATNSQQLAISAVCCCLFAGQEVAVAKIGEHAVVLGASMGGLLATRVLADFYRTVTVVERDVLPTESAQRRGVPQGRHVHALWPRGSEILEGLFPGFLTKLVSDGSIVWNDGDFSKLRMSFGGHEFVRSGTWRDIQPRDWVYYASRPFLEDHVRQRVRAIPNVTLMEGHDVVELTSNADRTRVTGALVTSRDDGEERTVTADLVVDATGRGSRTPAFLDHLGYDRPVEEEVVMRLVYASQLLRIPPGMHDALIVLVGPVPGRPTGMGLFTYENNTWLLTAIGLAGREPPANREGMLKFIEDCTPPQVFSALQHAEPLGEVTAYRTPSSRWRRYDKMRRFPAGLLVFGDAICSFNPIYGQGMTVAALQAMALNRCLSGGAEGLASRYFRAAAKPIGVAWQLAVGGDLSLPEIEGPRPLSTRLVNKYVERVQTAAETNIIVAGKFLRVAGFASPPASLMYPSTVLRVAATNWRRQRHSRASATPDYATANPSK
jgi:2-polyprenyl-6-methoxyphenol hydroxylase-like FAD-dependent oxidoreductase